MSAGAWGKKPSDAIRAPPPPLTAQQQQQQQQQKSQPQKQHPHASGGRSSNHNNTRQRPHGPPGPAGRGGGAGTGGRTSGGGAGTGGRTSGGGAGTGGRTSGGGRGRGRGNHNNANPNHHHNHQQHQNPTMLNVDLLTPGEGSTPQQKAVKRFTVQSLVERRLHFLDPPTPDFVAPEHCAWLDATRVDEIQKVTTIPSKLGDVSEMRRQSTTKETAPPLEECEPLQKNDATRWKARIFETAVTDAASAATTTTVAADGTVTTTPTSLPPGGELTDEEVLKKALLILNKLSLTKFEKLSQEFVATGVGRNPVTLSGAVNMIVDKAQSEPHFSSMYAQLCLHLTKVPNLVAPTATDGGDASAPVAAGGSSRSTSNNNKAFKKLLLTRCQAEFEEEMSKKIAKAIAGITDVDEQAYHEGLIKKKYLGHMRFIGELYKGDLIKLEVMLFCLGNLLEGYEEEKIECFTKLMTTVGFPLEQQSAVFAQAGKLTAQEQLNACWKKVDEIASEGSSARIKFMLLDLKEMRDNGWITRRKEEKVMTIDQIHKEVAKEEANAARRSSRSSIGGGGSAGLRRSSSDLRRSVVDQDGFVQIVPTSRSSGNLLRAVSDAVPNPPKPAVRRAQSFSVAPKSKSPPGPSRTVPPLSVPTSTKTANPTLSLDEINTKAQQLLKEYLVGGDLAEAIKSIDELVRTASDGSDERGAKVVEAFVLLIMECKPEDVDKMLNVAKAAHEQMKLADQCFLKGLDEPLEFLSDIEIDAPLARTFMIKIIDVFSSFVVGVSFEAAAATAREKK